MSIEARHWFSKRVDYTRFEPVGWRDGLWLNGLARKRTRTAIRLNEKRQRPLDAAFFFPCRTLRFPLALLGFVDGQVQMLDCLGPMSMEIALGMRHMVAGAAHRLQRLVHPRMGRHWRRSSRRRTGRSSRDWSRSGLWAGSRRRQSQGYQQRYQD